MKGHALALGIPVQTRIGAGPAMAVPLITGKRLIFGDGGFSIDRG